MLDTILQINLTPEKDYYIIDLVSKSYKESYFNHEINIKNIINSMIKKNQVFIFIYK